jgi:uncharacterized membrane protein YagU involved in acid resistance
MLREAGRGAAATLVMSVPMAVRWAAQRDVPPPPMTVAERAQRAVGLEPAARNAVLRHATWIAAHLGFGATVGALARLWPARARSRAAADGYGAAVWLANYGLTLPALGLYPPLGRDARLRAFETFVSHLVYAEALRALSGKSPA